MHTGGLTPGRNSRRQRHPPALDDEELFVVEGFPLAEGAHSCTSAKTNYSVLSCGISTVFSTVRTKPGTCRCTTTGTASTQNCGTAVFCTVWTMHLSSTTTGMSTIPKNCTCGIDQLHSLHCAYLSRRHTGMSSTQTMKRI